MSDLVPREQLGRLDEALAAIRSAIGDDPFDEELQEIERRLITKRESASG